MLKKAKIEDEFFKYELILEMRCMIHIYAETLADIIRLEGVIGLQGTCIAMRQRDQALVEQGREEGRVEGHDEGAFEIALRAKRVLGLETALSICDFSREELENEKLNR